jgi:hypothetical protein
MFSRWTVTNITSARETVLCLKTRIPCGDQLVICGLQKPCRKICEASLCVVWELVSDERYVAVIQLGKSFLVTHPSPAVSYDFSQRGGGGGGVTLRTDTLLALLLGWSETVSAELSGYRAYCSSRT